MTKISGKNFIEAFGEINQNINDLKSALHELGFKKFNGEIDDEALEKDKRVSIKVIYTQYKKEVSKLNNLLKAEMSVTTDIYEEFFGK